ncbi:hypothetical protein [Verminephrobacter eiseniae]|uniref:hypothetical protein n=1 Tax=Verminephrobacter eiseniae TaxID=364317 RepID=UPI0022380741|nr:hypothetical protein [Verminephrobacter eiseniae]MCW5293672.1 hypothetical protein [Verminephrobacter eiseniae]MCW8183463.1 hypothetical protein [Verminephrobacter eiseniae]MCW8224708.1 hypothetical protein [Verminephrobacter eiseniae]MCW8235792.1 hypothetical protein [Verminephrobacter eiseniae]
MNRSRPMAFPGLSTLFAAPRHADAIGCHRAPVSPMTAVSAALSIAAPMPGAALAGTEATAVAADDG